MAVIVIGAATPVGAITSPDAPTTASGNVTSVALALPASTAFDVLVAQISVASGATITPPSSSPAWTEIRSDAQGTSIRQTLYWRVRQATDSGSFTFTISPRSNSAGSLIAFKGVDTSDPIMAHSGQPSPASTTITAPAITTTAADAMIVAYMTAAIGGAGDTISTPSGFPSSRVNDVGNAVINIEAASMVQASAVSTGTVTSTTPSAVNVGQLIALRKPTVQFAASAASGSESTTSPTSTVTLSGVSSLTTTVAYTAGGASTATGGGTDYTLGGSGTLSFAAGETTKTIALSIVDDSLGEADETIVLTLSGPSEANLGSTTSHTYTILNNDPRIASASDPVDATGTSMNGVRWGAWAAEPGATNVASTNYVRVENIGTVAGQQFMLDFTIPSGCAAACLVGVTDTTDSIALANRIQYRAYEDATPATVTQTELDAGFGPYSTSSSGSLTLGFTQPGYVYYVQYRLAELPALLTEQAYHASFTVSEI